MSNWGYDDNARTWRPPNTSTGPHGHVKLDDDIAIDRLRLTSLEAGQVTDDSRLDSLEATVANMANFLKATTAGKLIQSGSAVGTTNGGGGLTIAFPTAFAAAPTVLVCNGDASVHDNVICGLTQGALSASSFEVVATNAAGSRIGSVTLRFNWIAFGVA